MEASPSTCKFKWIHEQQMRKTLRDGKMEVFPKANTDMWCRTYYEPQLIAFNAPVWSAPLDRNSRATLTVSFLLKPVNQFDQARVCVVIDKENWIKAGIEFVDGQARLSAVVTNNGYSDWSTSKTESFEMTLRLHQRESSFVIEVVDNVGSTQETAEFFRIAHLGGPDEYKRTMVGVYACCPEKSGGSATFSAISLRKGSSLEHAYDPNR